MKLNERSQIMLHRLNAPLSSTRSSFYSKTWTKKLFGHCANREIY